MKKTFAFNLLLVLILTASSAPQPAAQQAKNKVQSPTGQTTVKRVDYHGWHDALVLGNGQVEAIIVPSIGRVMQFRFVGEEDGPFWNNRELDGQAVDPKATEWVNFGGDKPWPAPQNDWPKVTARGWPPPVGFDSSVWEAKPLIANFSRLFAGSYSGPTNLGGTVIEIISPPDPHYGIRTSRYVQIDPSAPVLRIKTVYEKVSGEPSNVAVWVITQCRDPLGIFVPTPEKSNYPNGYHQQSKELPQEFKAENNLIFLRRDLKKATKIGTDAGSIVWVGEKYALRIDSPRVSGADYPDNGSSAEVYTHPVPAYPYVELEMLGPLRLMRAGDKIERVNVYTLLRRSQPDIYAEAKEILRR